MPKLRHSPPPNDGVPVTVRDEASQSTVVAPPGYFDAVSPPEAMPASQIAPRNRYGGGSHEQIPASGKFLVPDGFLCVAEMVERIIEREDPDLVARMRHDHPEWLLMSVHERNAVVNHAGELGSEVSEWARKFQDHPTSRRDRIIHSLKVAEVDSLRRFEDLRKKAEPKLWQAMIEGRLAVQIGSTDFDPVSVPQSQLEENGFQCVFRKGEVVAVLRVLAPDQKFSCSDCVGTPAVAETDFEVWFDEAAQDSTNAETVALPASIRRDGTNGVTALIRTELDGPERELIIETDVDLANAGTEGDANWGGIVRAVLGLRIRKDAFLRWYAGADFVNKPSIWAETDPTLDLPRRLIDLCALWASRTGRSDHTIQAHLIRAFWAGHFELNGAPETLAEGRDAVDAATAPKPIALIEMWEHVGGRRPLAEATNLSVRDWTRLCDDWMRSEQQRKVPARYVAAVDQLAPENSQISCVVVPDEAERSKHVRGRRPKYAWASVLARLRAKLEEDGYPNTWDGGQARLEEWVAKQFAPDFCPSESTIRGKVARVIQEHKRALGVRADN